MPGLGLAELGLLAVPLGLLVVRSLRSPSRDEVEAFQAAHGVTLNEDTGPMVETYLRRGRLYRTIGGALGFFLLPLGLALAGVHVDGLSGWRALLVGYLVGAAAAGVAPLPVSNGLRTALVSPRRLPAYVPWWALAGVRLVPLLALSLYPLYAWAEAGREQSGMPTLGQFAGGAAVTAVLALGTEVLARAVLRRRQPAVARDLVQADDAVRSSSLHAVIGAGLAAELLLLADQLWDVLVALKPEASPALVMLRHTLTGLSFLAFLLALASWVHLVRPRSAVVRRGPGEAPA